MLRPISAVYHPADYPDLLVGLDSPDDAAVWQLDSERALVVTTDFFTPVVDDPYDYGAIAAANSLSDVYAMGGVPFLALNIAALPPDLPNDISAEIVRGGAEKAKEAGVVIAGGHTIQDKEPKYGLVVLGMVDTRKIISKAGARSGDILVLSKPLGFGATTTALKRGLTEAQEVREVTGWMKRLNREASQAAGLAGVRGGTDITGYSLLGHAHEMAQASGVGMRIDYDRLPMLTCAEKYAAKYTFPGGAADNALYFGQFVSFEADLSEGQRMLLFDPQTSGGLLLCVPPEGLDAFLKEAERLGQPVWQVGEVVEDQNISVYRGRAD